MEQRFAARMDGVAGSAIRDIFKMIADPSIISFAGGNPLAASFPKQEIADIAKKLLMDKGESLLQYGATEGYAPLREDIADLMGKRGVKADPSWVLPLTGSSQGIEGVSKILLDPGDCVLCEAPTFLGALQTFFTYQARVIGVDTDDSGMVMDDLEDKIKRYRPKFIYTIPTFQNPTGVTMSVERRQRVAELAGQYAVTVLEDDPYGELRYEGEPLPSIQSFDTAGRVVHLVSFSKTISPGLRVGAAVTSDPVLLRKLVIVKQGADVHTANLNQAIVDEYYRSGRYAQHVKEILSPYREQLFTMLDMLKMFPQGSQYTQPDGGLFVWAELPSGLDAAELLKEAVSKKVAYVPGTHFYPDLGHKNTMRLNFSNASPDKIKEGMTALAGLFTEAAHGAKEI